jgi:hypothetical protein
MIAFKDARLSKLVHLKTRLLGVNEIPYQGDIRETVSIKFSTHLIAILSSSVSFSYSVSKLSYVVSESQLQGI